MRLLECFSPVFAYGLQLDEQARTGAPLEALAPLQARASGMVVEARTASLAEGKPLPQVEMAAFAAVAWFDEVVMRHDRWKNQGNPLQQRLFRTSEAASEFFDHLAGLPSDADEVREVFGMALLLGFAGQYYYERGDGGELGRIKALHCRPSVTAPAILQSLQRDPITPQPYLAPGSPLLRLPGAWASRRAVQRVATLVVWLVLAAFVGPIFSSAAPAQAWYLAGLAVTVIALLGWAGALAWHAQVVRRAHTRVAVSTEAGYGIGDLWATLRDAGRHLRGALLHPFRRRGEWRRLSRHPWLIFLGDDPAEVRGLLQAAAHAPHARTSPGQGDARPWYWWVFRAVVAIEPGMGLLREPGDPRHDESPWMHALAQLARERRKLPADGMVLCVAVQTLLGVTPSIEACADRLYAMADAATRRLQLQLPLYIVVTGMEGLPGYATFRTTLPSSAFRRALGCRIGAAPGGHHALGRMDVHGEMVIPRMRAAALAALAVQGQPRGRRELFALLQSLPRLQRGLDAFLDRLRAGEARGGRRLAWCGLYVTGGSRAQAPGGDFADDLFARFLPADRVLARRIAPEG